MLWTEFLKTCKISVYDRGAQQNSILNHFKQFFFILVLQKWKRPPKPLLGCKNHSSGGKTAPRWHNRSSGAKLLLRSQNWVTKAGGCHNLLPGLHLYRASGAGVVCHMLLFLINSIKKW